MHALPTYGLAESDHRTQVKAFDRDESCFALQFVAHTHTDLRGRPPGSELHLDAYWRLLTSIRGHASRSGHTDKPQCLTRPVSVDAEPKQSRVIRYGLL